TAPPPHERSRSRAPRPTPAATVDTRARGHYIPGSYRLSAGHADLLHAKFLVPREAWSNVRRCAHGGRTGGAYSEARPQGPPVGRPLRRSGRISSARHPELILVGHAALSGSCAGERAISRLALAGRAGARVHPSLLLEQRGHR